MKTVMVASLAIALTWQLGCKERIAREKNPQDVPPKQVEQAAQAFSTEQRFLERTSQVVRSRIELAKLAQSKAQNPDVKAYAERTVNEYSAMLNGLQKLAQAESVTLPGDVNVPQQELVAKLRSKSGSDFDKAYMQAEVGAQQEMITLLQGAIEKAQTPALKDFATVNLISVRDRAEEAQAIAKKVHA